MNRIIMDKKVINIIDDSNDLNYEIDNQELVINIFCNDLKSININIIQNNNSNFILNMAGYINNDCVINIKNDIRGNDNKCIINYSSISNKNNGIVNAIVKAKSNTSGNYIVENLKGINEEGTIFLNPILEIDTLEVDASHYATIGSFDENELFYLYSNGISPTVAYELLKNKFLYKFFDKTFIELLKNRKEKDE